MHGHPRSERILGGRIKYGRVFVYIWVEKIPHCVEDGARNRLGQRDAGFGGHGGSD